MKIRHKITLWIAGTVFLAGAGLSFFIFNELLEEPYRLIDNELTHMANFIFRQIELGGGHLPESFNPAVWPYLPDQYWIMVTGREGETLYKSRLTKIVDLPRQEKEKAYNIEKKISRRFINLAQDDREEVLFRVKEFRHQWQNKEVTVLIAKPIEAFEEEVDQFIVKMALGFGTYILLIVIASYLMAGRILDPIVRINMLARKISDSSLERRITLGKNKDELYELTLSLNRMFDRLQFSFARQKEFVGNAAHELKSPLTLLMLAQEDLLQRFQDDGKLCWDLVRQGNILRRMKRLIKNLLDLSRLEQQERLHFTEVDLPKLVTSVLSEYGAMIETGTIQVKNQLPNLPKIEGDRETLYRLIVNLVDNAWRYNCKTAGVIKITGHKTKNGVQLVIANSGPGVPPAETHQVFEQFYRVEKSRSYDHGGSGLGLTIAKKIVDLHGGSIDLASEAGNWTTVTVYLPART